MSARGPKDPETPGWRWSSNGRFQGGNGGGRLEGGGEFRPGEGARVPQEIRVRNSKAGSDGSRSSGEVEGFGLVTLESLSCGTPVLGTRIGAIPELLERFDPQWIIKEPTPKEIAATILSASGQPPPSPNDLHSRINAEFDWSKIAKHYLELFESLV